MNAFVHSLIILRLTAACFNDNTLHPPRIHLGSGCWTSGHYVDWKKYLYSYRPTGGGPDRPEDSFRTTDLPARAEGCSLFDRPKRGRKKPHQPALAHVRSRRRAGPRCGGRLGSASGQRTGRARRVILRTRSCVAQTSIRTAPRCAAWPPLAPHRERPGRRAGARMRLRTPVVFFFRPT